MTITLFEMSLYAGALLVLFLTPGPVWLAVIARGISGGLWAVLPLTLGVVIGDIVWPLIALLGITALTSVWENFFLFLSIFGMLFFVIMGAILIKNADHSIAENKALSTPGIWAGFSAGLLAIGANPKAMLFYLGLLPSFFELNTLTSVDILLICAVSAIVPFVGNIALAFSMDRVRQFLKSKTALRRVNIGAGWAMIIVGIVIAISP